MNTIHIKRNKLITKVVRSTRCEDSAVNVSQIITVDKSFLREQVSRVSARVMLLVEDGLRLVLAL
jgi:mRNA-degrading endonuclease toxin of MazEF toxin-antitoxin module